jgi:hypothetical protein
MTEINFSLESSLRAFDKLVELGVIQYGPSESVPQTSDGFSVSLFRSACSSLH